MKMLKNIFEIIMSGYAMSVEMLFSGNVLFAFMAIGLIAGETYLLLQFLKVIMYFAEPVLFWISDTFNSLMDIVFRKRRIERERLEMEHKKLPAGRSRRRK